MKSSLVWDANKRVDEYLKSVKSVQENVLLFKGFLGPSLKDKPELSSVGARAARAAGVIVDEMGKLRCPPGTPNANQFTDMQMSNCMVPGMAAAQRAVRAGRREVGEMLSNAKRILDNKPASSATKVAALTALATLDALDYWNVDGSGTMSGVTLIGVDLLRTVGRDVADLALNRLERKGKITKEQRQDIDAIVDKIHEIGSSKYTAALISTMRRRNRKRKRRLETPQMDEADASAPDETARPDDMLKVTFDADSFNTELDAKVNKLLDKYIPNKKHMPFEEMGDEMMASMGLPPTSRNAKKMIEIGLKDLEQSLPQKIADFRDRNKSMSDDHYALRLQGADRAEQIQRMLETKDGREQIRKEIGKGFVEALVGVESMLQNNPSLRGKFAVEIHDTGDRKPGNAGGYAFIAASDNGQIVLAQRFMALTLLIDNDSFTGGKLAKGDLADGTIRITGADDLQVNLAIHETSHVAHYAEILNTIGLEPSLYSKSAIEQLRDKGNELGDTFVGARFAMYHGIDPASTWDDVERMYADPKMRKEIFPVRTDSPSLAKVVGEFAGKLVHSENVSDSDSALELFNKFVSIETSRNKKAKLLMESLNSLASGESKIFSFDTSDEQIKDLQSIRQLVESQLDGQTVEEFMSEGKALFDGVLGVDSTRIQTKGVKHSDVMRVLGSASKYGKTNSWEAVAESNTLAMLVKSFPDSKVLDDFKFEEAREMLEQIMPSGSGSTKTGIMTPEAKAWVARLQDVANNLPDVREAEFSI